MKKCPLCGKIFTNEALISCTVDHCRLVNIQDKSINKKSYTFQYVISLLIPLVGYILGACLLAKDNDEDKKVGKQCIMFGIISNIISVIIVILIMLS